MNLQAEPTPEVPHRQPRRRWARGPSRPSYLQPADVDQLLHIVVALMSEVSALRDRVDTHELLGDEGRWPSPAAVEAHRPGAEQAALREQRRRAMLGRCLRVLTEQLESAGEHLAGQVREAGDGSGQ